MVIAGITELHKEDIVLKGNDAIEEFITFVQYYDLSVENILKLIGSPVPKEDTKLFEIQNNLRKEVLKLIETRSRYFISFEGVDATGKGTISRFFESFFKWLGIEAERINIPNYNLESGKIISNALNTNITEEELYKRRYEFINHFAVNRKEVQTNYRKEQYDDPKIYIFDRWINSSIAFSVAKTILHLDKDIDNITKSDEALILDTIDYNYNLELNVLKNDLVDIEYVITSDIDIIQQRINNRKQQTIIQNNTDNPDNDVFQNDQHEKNNKLLTVTQEVFKSLENGSINSEAINYKNRAAISTYIIENNQELKLAIFNCLRRFLK